MCYQVLLYPVTSAEMETESYKAFATGYWLTADAMRWFWNAYAPEKDIRSRPEVSPLAAPIERLQGLPPALVITGEYDVLRDEGEAYAHHLIQAGVPVTAVRFLSTIHDFAMLNALAETPAAREAVKLASEHLAQAFSA
jgi:acetyl esterase